VIMTSFRLGPCEIGPDVKFISLSGDFYDHGLTYSDFDFSVDLQRAIHENWQNCQLVS
jgi:hypothetical protein